jgi:hypothetical protein
VKNVDVEDRCAGAIATGEPGGGSEDVGRKRTRRFKLMDDG